MLDDVMDSEISSCSQGEIPPFYQKKLRSFIRLRQRNTIMLQSLRIIKTVTFTGCCSTATVTTGGALASSLISSSITNWPCLKSSNSCFSTSSFRRLFLMRILRFSILGGGSGTPGSSCFSGILN